MYNIGHEGLLKSESLLKIPQPNSPAEAFSWAWMGTKKVWGEEYQLIQ